MPNLPQQTPKPHIALVGFMGSGKTTISRILAKIINYQALDLDEQISLQTGKSVADMFREQGEAAFRNSERQVLKQILQESRPLLLATGGGTYIDPEMRALLESRALTIYLEASYETLLKRFNNHPEMSAKRPLLQTPISLEFSQDILGKLLQTRLPIYQKCAYTLNTDDKTIPEIIDELVAYLGFPQTLSPPKTPNQPTTPRALSDMPLATSVTADAPTTPALSATKSLPRTTPLKNPADPAELLSPLMVQTPTSSYAIHFNASAENWLVPKILSLYPQKNPKFVIITDNHVASLHGENLQKELKIHGKMVPILTFTRGETSKNLNTVLHLYEKLLELEMTRHDVLIALGGGVVGDITGFVASTFMRGLDYLQIPTTTLAAVDSSVGGKTGVNLPLGKNLVGTFYQPKAVLIIRDYLATQSLKEHASGLVEAFKMAISLDADLFNNLLQDAPQLLTFNSLKLLKSIRQAVGLKATIVNLDEQENNERAVLNYGHTVGHALETGEAYKLSHGEAVGLGMLAESNLTASLGMSDKRVCTYLERALQSISMPTNWFARQIDFKALGADKKRLDTYIRLPVVSDIGRYEFTNLPLNTLITYLRSTHRA